MDPSLREDSNGSRLDDSNLNGKTKKKKTLDDYEFIVNDNGKTKTSDLGKGSYGSVKKVKEKESGKIYAMKIMNKKSIFEYSNKENLRREITIQKSISHPHITRLYNYFEDKENVYLILEFADNGNLFHYLRNKRKFTENEAFIYFFQTCLGIDFLHKKKIIHRDLKPENLLLDRDGNIKICDFGWSAESYSKRVTFCGTIDYMAPEMIKNLPHDHRLDIWCLGVLLYEMLHGYAPFKGKTDADKCLNISKNAPIDFDKNVSSEVVDLIKNILKPSPVDRYAMSQIFRHSWMKKFEKVYNIDIETLVREQDESLKNLEKNEEKPKSSVEAKSSIDSTNDTINSNYSNPGSGGNNQNQGAKIITIIDNTSPLNLNAKKFSFDEKEKVESKNVQKPPKYGVSGANNGNSDIDKLLKEYNVDQTKENDIYNKIDQYSSKGFKKDNNPSTSVSKNYIAGLKNNSNQINQPSYTGKDLAIYEDRNEEITKYVSKAVPQRAKSGYLNDSFDGGYKKETTFTTSSGNGYEKSNRHQSVDKAQIRDNKKKTSQKYESKKVVDEDDEIEPARLSRISKRNLEIEKKLKNKKDSDEEEEEPGIFEKILLGLGCISRDSKTTVKK